MMGNRTQKFCSIPLLFFPVFLPRRSSENRAYNVAFKHRIRSISTCLYRHCNALHFGNKHPVKCLVQGHNKRIYRLVHLHTIPLMLNVKQESCEYHLFKSFGLI